MGKARSTRQPSNQPERKIGPFSGGITVAIWINEIDSIQGARKGRSVTISPRRYRDAESHARVVRASHLRRWRAERRECIG